MPLRRHCSASGHPSPPLALLLVLLALAGCGRGELRGWRGTSALAGSVRLAEVIGSSFLVCRVALMSMPPVVLTPIGKCSFSATRKTSDEGLFLRQALGQIATVRHNAPRNAAPADRGSHRLKLAGKLVLAFLGGGLMGYGARFARGCTSGQALSGGAVLSVGSWAFMFAVFAGAYFTAIFVRRLWR